MGFFSMKVFFRTAFGRWPGSSKHDDKIHNAAAERVMVNSVCLISFAPECITLICLLLYISSAYSEILSTSCVHFNISPLSTATMETLCHSMDSDTSVNNTVYCTSAWMLTAFHCLCTCTPHHDNQVQSHLIL